MELDVITTAYNAWGKTYDSDPNELIPIEQLAVHSLLRTIEGRTVLDAATGTGRYALHFAEQGKQVTGVDASEGMLSQAIEKATAQNLPVRFLRGDIACLPLADNAFDLVICALALSHNQSLTEPCREFVRVMCGGGNLIISDLHPHFQKVFGANYQLEIADKSYAYPLYHDDLDDYLIALNTAGANVLTALDVPSQFKTSDGERVTVPGALVIWAKKP
jgi:SAM-dependent methyltransferase